MWRTRHSALAALAALLCAAAAPAAAAAPTDVCPDASWKARPRGATGFEGPG
jgi:hypothetical protein